MDSGTVLALLAFAGTVITNLLQYFINRKKTNLDTVTQLIEKAMQLNAQELSTVRALYNEETVRRKELESKLDDAESKIEAVQRQNEEYKLRLEKAEKCLEKCEQTVRILNSTGLGENKND